MSRKPMPPETATKTEGVQKTQEDERTSTREPNRSGCALPKSSWEAVGTCDAPSWKYTGTQENTVSWGSLGAQPPSNARARHFIHTKQFGAFLRRLVLPYPYEEILSGYEEDVSSIRDGFTAWVKSEPETILRRHVVDVTRASAAFRKTLSFLPRVSLQQRHAQPFD